MEQMLKKELDHQKNIKISLTEEQYQLNHDLFEGTILCVNTQKFIKNLAKKKSKALKRKKDKCLKILHDKKCKLNIKL